MAYISETSIEEVRSRCDIVEVVGSYLPQLRRRGSTFKCNCPFHQEKTPSFTVNEARQIFHCFGCGAGGDVFRFVMEYEKVDFPTAIHILADRYGIKLVYEGRGGVDGKKGNKDILYKIHREASSFFHQILLNEAEAIEGRRYLEERNFSKELLKEFQIGFAPNEWDGLIKYAQKKGFSLEDLESAGLVVLSSEQSRKKQYYDRFRNRIMFPICDAMGRVIGFSGRIINKAEKSAKYVNSPETLLFHKSQVLFAFDKARKPIVESRQAIVVEGQIDAIRCHQAGLHNVVASQGTALTQRHAQLIKRYADEVVLVLDADVAGIKAALASSEIFIANEVGVRVVTLPENEDPDSFIQSKGVDVLKKLIKEAPSALYFLIEYLRNREDMQNEAGRMRVIKATLNLIQHSPSATRRDTMIHQASDQLHISPQALVKDLHRVPKDRRKSYQSQEELGNFSTIKSTKTYPQEEVGLLELMIHYYDEVQPLVRKYLTPAQFSDSVCRNLVEILKEDFPDILTKGLERFSEEEQKMICKMQIGESRKIDEEMSALELGKSYILLLWKRTFKRELSALSKDITLSNEERFKRATQLRHDLHILSQGWDASCPLIETHLTLGETDTFF